MNNLLLFRGETQGFDREAVVAALRSIPCVERLCVDEAGSAAVECAYVCRIGETIIRLKPDMKAVSFAGVGDVSLMAAWAFQQAYGSALRMVDWDYSFDIDLSKVASFEDLRRQVRPSS